MPVAFGWSVGDIAKAIELLSTALKGLKETGGAASEYQQISDFLKGLIVTLQYLQNLQLKCTDPKLTNAIKALGDAALRPIFEFVDEVSKYETSLCRSPTEHKVKSWFRKAAYALRDSKHVAKLQADIAMKLEPIHLLMEGESMKQSSLTATKLCDMQDILQTHADDQANFNLTLMTAITELTTALPPKIVCDSRMNDVAQSALSRHGGECLTDDQASQSTLSLVSLSPRDDGNLSEWKQAGDQLFSLLLFLLLKIGALTKYLLLATPQMMLYIRTLFAMIPRSTRLLLLNDIRLEDMLGRVHYLPYQYFSHWPVFKPYLRELFRDQPGQDLVTRDQFLLLTGNYGGVIEKDRRYWSVSIHPGSNIIMSASLWRCNKISTTCPRCRTTLRTMREGLTRRSCPMCSWEWFTRSGADITDDDNEGGDENVAGQSTSRLFKSSRSLTDRDLAVFKRIHTVSADLVRAGGVVAWRWHCCNCGEGPYNPDYNPRCANCCDHNRCGHCIVETYGP